MQHSQLWEPALPQRGWPTVTKDLLSVLTRGRSALRKLGWLVTITEQMACVTSSVLKAKGTDARCHCRRKQIIPLRNGGPALRCTFSSFWPLLWQLWRESAASAGGRDLQRVVLSVRITLRTKFLLISLPVAALRLFLGCWCLWQKQPAGSVLATWPVGLECSVSCGLSHSHCANMPFLFPLHPSLFATLSASSAGESREAVGKSWGFDLRGSVPLSAWTRGHWVRGSRADLSQGPHASLFEEFITAKDSERVWCPLSVELSVGCSPPPCSNDFCLERTR